MRTKFLVYFLLLNIAQYPRPSLQHFPQEGGCIAASILNFGADMRRVFTFTLRPLFPKEKPTVCYLNMRLGGS
jgi:hypothetical protein